LHASLELLPLFSHKEHRSVPKRTVRLAASAPLRKGLHNKKGRRSLTARPGKNCFEMK